MTFPGTVIGRVADNLANFESVVSISESVVVDAAPGALLYSTVGNVSPETTVKLPVNIPESIPVSVKVKNFHQQWQLQNLLHRYLNLH